MTWRDPNDDERDDPRKIFRKWFGSFFSDDIFRQMEEMMERMVRNMEQGPMFDRKELEEFMRSPNATNPFVMGFSVRIGPDGKPVIQRFGNALPEDERTGPQGTIEPLVDILEEDDEVVVVAEVPGVGSDEISVKVRGKTLTIHTDNPQRPYHKEIQLPVDVKKGDASSSIRNGVLEVRLKKS